ncbi:MAG: hypothetical protein R3D56_06840 [Paracoccaceae bacterium]
MVKIGLFLLGFLCFLLAVLAEVGLSLSLTLGAVATTDRATPGLGIRMLGLIDAGLAWTLLLMAIDFIRPMSAVARVQGIVTLILSFFGVLGGIVLIFTTLALIMLMISLLLAVPFGTLAYLAAWGDFPKGAARAALGLIMVLKLLGALFLVLASPSLLKNKGLVVLLLFSIGSTFLTGFLIAFVPAFVAAIADAIGALISAILGTVWLLVMLIGAIFAVIRAIRSLAPG